jgi:Spy/CpxP family protein refolding chaperone
MRRSASILAAGLLLGVAAYICFYAAGTASHPAMSSGDVPETAWLKREFRLSDADFKRITELHAAYQPQCAEMCRRIDAKNAELEELLSKAATLTPEIELKLEEAGQLRVQCQKNMLRHFLEVSRSMPPEQGARYLAWVTEKTLLPDHKMHSQASVPESSHEHGPRQ